MMNNKTLYIVFLLVNKKKQCFVIILIISHMSFFELDYLVKLFHLTLLKIPRSYFPSQ